MEMGNLYAIYNIPHINQVHVLFRARLLDLDFKPVSRAGCPAFEEAESPGYLAFGLSISRKRYVGNANKEN